jgi:hypothetical protein
MGLSTAGGPEFQNMSAILGTSLEASRKKIGPVAYTPLSHPSTGRPQNKNQVVDDSMRLLEDDTLLISKHENMECSDLSRASGNPCPR